MVLLIGNYLPDQQQSMQRFSAMMLQGLTASGLTVELITPEPIAGNFKLAGRFIGKWLGYLDKFIWFPLRLKQALAKKPDVIHICDHSNAVYVRDCRGAPVLVTCHDLLAVRAALGEDTGCPASLTGRVLQRWILNGLRGADVIACVSSATARDAERLVTRGAANPRIETVALGLNYPYVRLSASDSRTRRAKIGTIDVDVPFALHVGSNQRRKNREGVLRIFALCKDKWNGRLVFAGDRLNPELTALSETLGVADRITQLENPDSSVLETLYNCAVALLYPSRFEGFGWPIIEAQACGCPVICGNSGPLPEAAGEAGLIHDVEDEEGFANDLLRLTEPGEHARWSERSLRNAERFSTKKMIAHYIEIYRSLGAQL
ncbi:MAG: glycosyltransferase family 1 protein [Verrucomicrobiota bacterium]